MPKIDAELHEWLVKKQRKEQRPNYPQGLPVRRPNERPEPSPPKRQRRDDE